MSLGRLYPPPIVTRSGMSMSTLSTPNNEEELEAARDVLRAVISNKSISKQSPKAFISVSTQTDGVQLDGLIRAAGMSLAHFAAEVKSLERKLESQNEQILTEIRKLALNFSK